LAATPYLVGVPPPPDFSQLLSALTLGTARRELPASVREWIEDKTVTDASAEDGEHLLAALALVERTHRLRDRRYATSQLSEPSAPETRPPVDPAFARSLQLIFGGGYESLLEEAVELIHQRGTYLPAPLLPALHLRAAALAPLDYPRALRYLDAGGERGKWLARQHPEWHRLLADYDFATAFHQETQAGKKAILLTHWRHHHPAAARRTLEAEWERHQPRSQEILLHGLEPGLSPDDHTFLRAALGPKRRGVRRVLTRLLLLAGEEHTLADWTELARQTLTEAGTLGETAGGRNSKAVLQRYGSTAPGQRLPNRLLELLPPPTWPELTGLPPEQFWCHLRPLELRDAGRAILAYRDVEAAAGYLGFVIRTEARELPAELTERLVNLLPEDRFTGTFDRALEAQEDLLRLHGTARRLALQWRGGWSERLTRALVIRLIRDLEERHLDYGTQRRLAEEWEAAIPRVHPAAFPWLRQRLGAVTERYDHFGKLATKLLQTTAFRKSMRG
jgi:hypothetical protein